MITFPDPPPFPTMPLNTPDRRLMAMPAYLGGSFGTFGVKWYGSNVANRERGLPCSILMFMLGRRHRSTACADVGQPALGLPTGAVPGVVPVCWPVPTPGPSALPDRA